jgi:hypothetical protein
MMKWYLEFINAIDAHDGVAHALGARRCMVSITYNFVREATI